MLELETALTQARNAWLAGRSAADFAPAAWREGAGGDELTLLALAGHALDVVTQPSSAPLALRALLPELPTRLMPEALRARFRRLLATPKNAPSVEQALIWFVAARGYAAHPADWMPDAKDEWAPALYAPWLDWVRDEAQTISALDAELSADTYEQWSWTERRKRLEALRAANPDAARAIIAAKAGIEPAERRVRIIELLQIRLSAADTDFLASLLKDRSDRVQTLARAFLARLGQGVDASELATELASMVELSKVGLVRRRMQLAIKPLKTAAQHTRRRQLFNLVPLAALAHALCATEGQLVENAPEVAFPEALDFVACVAATGSDASVAALLSHMLEDKATPVIALRPLVERISAGERKALLPAIAGRDADMFDTALGVAGGALGQAPLAALMEAPSFEILRTNAEIFARGEDASRTAATNILNLMLPRMGLLIDVPGARELLAQMTALGLSPADPRLDMLHFNAALTEIAT
ncbi:MAG: DUF5691 domain-containing protein [Hyphomonadaceae bacterium JAD_PAG50586_4]|nr:MAG: DUF5691 domain-containing protein [Hyphomonadaceae bacterium JAD_PAG50586_4]